jgi:hypothetical protein
VRIPSVTRLWKPVCDLEPGDIVEVKPPRSHAEAARIVEILNFNPRFRNISARTDAGRREEGEAPASDTIATYVCSGYEATAPDKARSVLAAIR